MICQELKQLFPQVKPTDLITIFKFCIQNQQISERTEVFTRKMLVTYPSFLTLLKMRKRCFYQLKLPFQNQMELISENLRQNPKNYCFWHYRKQLVNGLESFDDTKFLNEILQIEQNNYHAWDYRLFLLNKNKNYQQQFQQMTNEVNKSLLNYSGWHYRYNILNKLIKINKQTKQQIFKQQQQYNDIISFVIDKLRKYNLQALWTILAVYIRQCDPDEQIIQFIKECTQNDNIHACQLMFRRIKGVSQDQKNKYVDKLYRVDKVNSKYWERFLVKQLK